MSLEDETKIALDESRMLMLGAQILLGFQLHAPFQNAFDQLSSHEKLIELLVLATMVVVVGLLITPSARHRIVEDGNASTELNNFITTIAIVILAPFSFALALDLYIAGTRVAGPIFAIFLGLFGLATALIFWFGPFALRRQPSDQSESERRSVMTKMSTKIEYILTESRVVLPGVQALLGFQLAIVLTTGFAELARPLRWLHGLAILLITVATVLLLTPATFHRIVYNGEASPRFYALASRLVLAATIFLALGLASDVYIVASKISDNAIVSTILSLLTAATLIGFWQVWPLLVKHSRNSY